MEADCQPRWVPQGQFAPQALGGGASVAHVSNAKAQAYDMRRQGMAEANRDAAKSLKDMLRKRKGE